MKSELGFDILRKGGSAYAGIGVRIGADLAVEGMQDKGVIDEIVRVLARHYGFTDEELDFIINYDIKYRMGKAAEGEEEE